MAPGVESKIERKHLTHKAFLNEMSAWANTEVNAFRALRIVGSIPVAKPMFDFGGENG